LDCDARGESKGHKDYLDAEDLRRVPKFDENPIAPRLIRVILDDFGSDGKLNFAQFVHFMSVFSQSERATDETRPIASARNQSNIAATNANKTDLETVRFSPDDTPKTRKVKFIFRVSRIVLTSMGTKWSFPFEDVRLRSRWTSIE
jgi:hypothetical protein